MCIRDSLAVAERRPARATRLVRQRRTGALEEPGAEDAENECAAEEQRRIAAGPRLRLLDQIVDVGGVDVLRRFVQAVCRLLDETARAILLVAKLMPCN